MKKLLVLFGAIFFLVKCSFFIDKNQNSSLFATIKDEASSKKNKTAEGAHYALSTQGIYASRAAELIFSQKGNIIDAAVAASFAISVERPHSTGLGGGGFMLYRDGKTKKTYAVDFRERAPIKSYEKMFLDSKGEPDTNLSRNGIMSVAVPGLVAGLIEIHTKFGQLPLEKVMAPAILLAENGFPIYPSLKRALDLKKDLLKKDPEAAKIFLDKEGNPWPLDHLLVQKDLAKTLKKIALKGKDAFYSGEIAEALIKFFASKKGMITKNDLKEYQVKWRTPVRGTYKKYEIFSMPPPSSGGIHVIQFLNQLENDDLYKKGLLSERSIHLAAQSLQSAFADRAEYLGDPDFTNVPVEKLISKDYAKKRRSQFNENKRRNSQDVGPGENLFSNESTETTHFSLMDDGGNAVSSTQTINGYMGAGMVIPKTGIVLNNEMDDFSSKPGALNLFGAIGSNKANAIYPRKTPLSSMSPTIVIKDGIPRLAIGAPGGTRIISCVAQSILNYIEFRVPLYEAIAMVRYHHQWIPDVLTIDPPGPSASVLKKLEKMNYEIQIKEVPCSVMAVANEENVFKAAADPRDIGTSLAN